MDEDKTFGSPGTPESLLVGSSRRRFLKSIGASGVALTSGSAAMMVSAELRPELSLSDGLVSPSRQSLRLIVNGMTRELQVEPNVLLLDLLRDELKLTGTKKGCDHGQCGACTVHANDNAINSCLSLAVMHDGESVTTVEGLGTPDKLDHIQQAFWERDAYQCGYCTAGQIMSAVAILNDTRIPADDNTLREAMSGNICRCGAYGNIISAIQEARRKLTRIV